MGFAWQKVQTLCISTYHWPPFWRSLNRFWSSLTSNFHFETQNLILHIWKQIKRYQTWIILYYSNSPSFLTSFSAPNQENLTSNDLKFSFRPQNLYLHAQEPMNRHTTWHTFTKSFLTSILTSIFIFFDGGQYNPNWIFIVKPRIWISIFENK